MRIVSIINNAGTLGVGFANKIKGDYRSRSYVVGVHSYCRLLNYVENNQLTPKHELGKGTIMSGAVFELLDKPA